MIARPMKFPTTQWNIVETLKVEDEEARRAALGEIIGIYGPPLLAFALRHAHGTRTSEDCEDLVNDFFLRCVQGGILARADRAKGKFRSFLATSFKYYVTNDQRSSQTQKRRPAGGFVSLAELTKELGPALEPRTTETPEDAFNRVLRRSLFEKVLREFADRCRAAGHEATFHLFLLRDVNPVREGTPVPTYAALAETCRLPSENFANKLSLAAREEFRSLLLAATSRDCATPEEAHAECELILATALRD
jgi:DNA-directed RNA polymerase specialized sigma24 family protein